MRTIIAPGSIMHPGEFDPWRTVVQTGPYCIDQVRENRQFANHHGGYNVGSIVVSYDPGSVAIGLFHGANQNLAEGENPSKVCAERVASQKAIDKLFQELLVVYNGSEPQPDTQSGKRFPTTHMCGVCRDTFKPVEQIKPHTICVSVHPESDIIEVRNYTSLVALHDDDERALKSDPTYGLPTETNLKTWQFGVELYEFAMGGLLPRVEVPEHYDRKAYIAQMAITGALEETIL